MRRFRRLPSWFRGSHIFELEDKTIVAKTDFEGGPGRGFDGIHAEADAADRGSAVETF